MGNKKRRLTRKDRGRLLAALSGAEGMVRDSANLRALAELLASMEVVEEDEISADVVTMNSRVALEDADTGERMTVTLAYPGDAEIGLGRMSVFSPVGTAILGRALGETAEWTGPARTRRIIIREIVYQPEARGDREL